MARTGLGRLTAAVAASALIASLFASAALAGNGNNGTVKTQEGSVAPDPITMDQPQVCTFHMQFLFADAGQAGWWRVDEQSPTGSATGVLKGTYTTDEFGQYMTVEYGLPIGHYSLLWQGRDDQNIKHKTFWVTCDNPPGEIGGGTNGEENPPT